MEGVPTTRSLKDLQSPWLLATYLHPGAQSLQEADREINGS